VRREEKKVEGRCGSRQENKKGGGCVENGGESRWGEKEKKTGVKEKRRRGVGRDWRGRGNEGGRMMERRRGRWESGESEVRVD